MAMIAVVPKNESVAIQCYRYAHVFIDKYFIYIKMYLCTYNKVIFIHNELLNVFNI